MLECVRCETDCDTAVVYTEDNTLEIMCTSCMKRESSVEYFERHEAFSLKFKKTNEIKKIKKSTTKTKKLSSLTEEVTPKKTKKVSSSEEKPKKKRGRSAYILYSMNNRSRVKEENPGASVTDIVKLLAKDWKDISNEEKKHYEDLALKERST
jgi:hypothetical protein